MDRETAGEPIGTSRVLQSDRDLDALIERIGDKRVVMLGEASHGTHEFYTWRAAITRRLIAEKGFSFVSVEGDWPDSYELNRYIKDRPDAAESARDALRQFERWPTWMWANEEIDELIEWLRTYNAGQGDGRAVGWYGLDVYSLWESMEAIIRYLQEEDPDAIKTAIEAYRCFEPFGDVTDYARATAFVPKTCEAEVLKLLREIQEKRTVYDSDGDEARFSAEQNAHVLRDAERYYRTMILADNASWNVRDEHMMDTLERLLAFHGPDAKGIVWAHNTHVGDARATDMARAGMFNIGQLGRQRLGRDNVALVGFGTYSGRVIAGSHWGAPMEEMMVPAARSGSWDHLLHTPEGENRLLFLSSEEDDNVRGQRAIGVVYNPRAEIGNYVPTVLQDRYDAFLFIDRTSALAPIQVEAAFELELV